MSDVKQHTYGSGEISFAPFLPGTQTPGALDYLGNTPEFTLTSEQEALDHFDTDHGIRVKDDSVVTQMNQSGSIVTDNINYANLARFFLGTASSIALTSATAQADSIPTIQFGTYQLGATNALPTGVRKISNVVVRNASGGPTTYVAGVDYVVDLEYGTITFLAGGTIKAGDPAHITYDRAASTRQQVLAGNKTVEGKLHFKSFNPVGPKVDYMMPWVKLTPNGDFAIKSDDWLTMPFSVEVLKKGALAPVYADGQAVTAA